MIEYETKLNKLLLDLFKEHDVDGFLIDNNTVFLDRCIKAHCHIFDRTKTQTTVVQLDVVFEIGLDKHIGESSTGIGEDLDSAVKNSFKGFTQYSFHTVLAAFFNSDYDDQVGRDEWVIGSKTYDVVRSNISIRGNKPSPLSINWIHEFEDIVQKEKFESGINWIRIFYAISNKQVTTCETLINNEIALPVQKKASNLDVTLTDNFYTLRLFYILQNGLDIGRLSAIISWATLYYDGDDAYQIIYNILKYYKLSDIDIEKAYLMIPIAISHVFIEGITNNVLGTKATIVNQNKQTYEINMNDEFFFYETYKWAKKTIIEQNSFISILQLSPLFNVLNDALKQGADPNDLEFSDTILIIRNYTSAENGEKIVKKPFWKFW